jgi:hypothetical protein
LLLLLLEIALQKAGDIMKQCKLVAVPGLCTLPLPHKKGLREFEKVSLSYQA